MHVYSPFISMAIRSFHSRNIDRLISYLIRWFFLTCMRYLYYFICIPTYAFQQSFLGTVCVLLLSVAFRCIFSISTFRYDILTARRLTRLELCIREPKWQCSSGGASSFFQSSYVPYYTAQDGHLLTVFSITFITCSYKLNFSSNHSPIHNLYMI